MIMYFHEYFPSSRLTGNFRSISQICAHHSDIHMLERLMRETMKVCIQYYVVLRYRIQFVRQREYDLSLPPLPSSLDQGLVQVKPDQRSEFPGKSLIICRCTLKAESESHARFARIPSRWIDPLHDSGLTCT